MSPHDFKQVMALGDKIMAASQRSRAEELLGGLVIRAINIVETARAESDNPEVYEIILETLTGATGGLREKFSATISLFTQLSQTVDYMMDDENVDHCGLMGLRVDIITTLLQTMGDSGQ